MSPARRTRIASLLLSLPLALWGCGASLQSIPSADVRAKLGTIGVASARFKPLAEFQTYARGGAVGAGIGMLRGADAGGRIAAPFGLGAPFIAMFTVPIGAAIGGGFGAQMALSVEKAREIDAALERALAESKVQESLSNAVLNIAQKRTVHRFLLLADQGPIAPEKDADYRTLTRKGTDTILEVSVQKLGWRDVILRPYGSEYALPAGEDRADPGLRLFMTARGRLVRVADGETLHVHVADYVGAPRKFGDWRSLDPGSMRKELESGYRELAERIVGRFFLANPSEPTDLAPVRSKQAAIVLFRVAASQDGSALSMPDLSIQTTTPLRRNSASSSEWEKKGWSFLVLLPGSHRISVGGLIIYDPETVQFPWRTGEGTDRPPFFEIKIPSGQQLLYAGSLHVKCAGNWQGTGKPACSADVHAEDETKMAREIAQAEFTEFGPLVTSLMQRE